MALKNFIRTFNRRQLALVGSLIIVISGTVLIVSRLSGGVQPAVNNTCNKVFQPVSPKDEPQLARLGCSAYNSAQQSYSYDDLYLGVPIRVSEQPLPKGYPDGAVAVAKIASYLGATSQINTSSGIAYVFASSSGRQTLVLSKNNLLIFIQSSYPITLSAWPGYVNTLM